MMALIPIAIRDIPPLSQYIQAIEKMVPYSTGTTCCHRKAILWKLRIMMIMIRRSEMPMDHIRSLLMVPALETLPCGLPCTRTRMSG